MLRSLKAAATNPSMRSNRQCTDTPWSLFTNRHSTHTAATCLTDGRRRTNAGAIKTRLWQCHADRPCNLCAASGSICAECGCSRLIYRLRRSDHITDALVDLQRLRVAERVEFKTAVRVYKVLHRQAPRYLGPLTRVADLPGRPAFRSTGSNRLHASETSLQKLRCILSSIIPRVTEVLYFCETALLIWLDL